MMESGITGSHWPDQVEPLLQTAHRRDHNTISAEFFNGIGQLLRQGRSRAGFVSTHLFHDQAEKAGIQVTGAGSA